MHVELETPELFDDLVEGLAGGGCLVVPLDRRSGRVTLVDADDADDALVSLAFYVRAWSTRHAHTSVTISP